MPLPGSPASQRSISPDSPRGEKPAFDILAQAASGVMSVNRETGQPTKRLGLPLGAMAGSILPLFGLLVALQERNVTRQASERGGRHAGQPDCDAGRPVAELFPDRAKPRTRRHPPPASCPAAPSRPADSHVIAALRARGAGRALNASRPYQRNRGADFPPRVQRKRLAATIQAGFRRGRLPGARAPGSVRHPITQDATGPSDPWPPCL